MKSTYIILKGKGQGTLEAATRGTGQIPASVSLEVDEIGKADLRDLRRDTNVIGIAPSMPMKLIEPRQGPAVGATAGTVAWGVKAVKADTSPLTGKGIVVAVLDTGIDSSHPAFAGVELVQKDFTGEGDGDGHGHGTHCAGTIFGRDVENMRIGVARGVDKAVIGKVLGNNGGGSSDEIIRAMLWALDEGANVLSMSLGMDFPGYVDQLVRQGLPTSLATSRALEAYRANVRALRYAHRAREGTRRGGTDGHCRRRSRERKRTADRSRLRDRRQPPSRGGRHRFRRCVGQHRRRIRRCRLFQHRCGGLGARRGDPIREGGRWSSDHERHEHGHTARGGRGGAMGGEAQESRPVDQHRARGAAHQFRRERRHQDRVRPLRRRQRNGHSTAAVAFRLPPFAIATRGIFCSSRQAAAATRLSPALCRIFEGQATGAAARISQASRTLRSPHNLRRLRRIHRRRADDPSSRSPARRTSQPRRVPLQHSSPSVIAQFPRMPPRRLRRALPMLFPAATANAWESPRHCEDRYADDVRRIDLASVARCPLAVPRRT